MQRLLPLGTAFVLVLTACGAGHKPAPRVTNTETHAPPTVKAIAAARERIARREAQRLLRELVLPGATPARAPRRYRGLLAESGPAPAAKMVDVHRIWSVHASLASVRAAVRTHVPDGFERFAYWSPRPHYLTLTYFSPAAARRPPTRVLDVKALALPGRTVLRVDAKVAWIYPRSPQEKVPAAVREVDLATPKLSRRITDPAQVRQVVGWFDALPISPPGIAVPCPLSLVPSIRLVFRSGDGTRLASASAPAGTAGVCNPISFSIHGHRQAPLIDPLRGPGFVDRLQRLLGVRLIESHR